MKGEFRLQCGNLQILWRSYPEYIETNVISDATRKLFKDASENIQTGVSRRNLDRPIDKRIVGRDLHKW